jgi:hypothetical protein
LCDPLSNGCYGTTPSRNGFRKPNCKRCHQPAIAVAPLEKPFPLERFARYPIEQERVNLRANGFHEIASETVASWCVNVKYADTGIKAESGGGQP